LALHQFSATRAMAAAKARFALAYRSDRRYTMYGKRQAHPMIGGMAPSDAASGRLDCPALAESRQTWLHLQAA
jgi:hypothetical protein